MINVTTAGSATVILPRKEHLYGKWVVADTPNGVLGNQIIAGVIKIVRILMMGLEDRGMTINAPMVTAIFAKHVPWEPFLEIDRLYAVLSPCPAANRRPIRQC